jgi:hypothetical protein
MWRRDFERTAVNRLPIEGGGVGIPAWTPDGRRLIFNSAPGVSAPNLYW